MNLEVLLYYDPLRKIPKVQAAFPLFDVLDAGRPRNDIRYFDNFYYIITQEIDKHRYVNAQQE